MYRVVWTINALLTVRSEMLPFSENNQNIKMFGAPRTLCHIGYVQNDNLPLGNIALQLCLSKQLQQGLMVFSDDFQHFLKIKTKICCILQNYLVALTLNINKSQFLHIFIQPIIKCHIQEAKSTELSFLHTHFPVFHTFPVFHPQHFFLFLKCFSSFQYNSNLIYCNRCSWERIVYEEKYTCFV